MQRVQLARALVDDRRLRVAQVALDRELVRVAVRAVDLDRVERRLDGVLGRVPLGEARLAGVAQALVLEPAGLPARAAGRSRCPAAILAIICLTSWCSADLLRRTSGARGRSLTLASRHAWASPTAPAATVKRPWSMALIAIEEALALLADPVLDRAPRTSSRLIEPGVAGPDARACRGACRSSGRASRARAMNAVTPLCFFARSTVAKTRKWSAMSARRDPDLLAVEPVRVAVAAGRRREVAGVGADARLGQPERGQLLAARLRARASAGAAPRSPTAAGPAS